MKNEPILGYLPGSAERADLESVLSSRSGQTEDVPIVIGGKEYRTDDVRYQPMVRNRMRKSNVMIIRFTYDSNVLYFIY